MLDLGKDKASAVDPPGQRTVIAVAVRTATITAGRAWDR